MVNGQIDIINSKQYVTFDDDPTLFHKNTNDGVNINGCNDIYKILQILIMKISF